MNANRKPRRVGVPPTSFYAGGRGRPPSLRPPSHRPRDFFKNSATFRSPCLRVASFAPAHVALRAAFGRLPGQRPLARVPLSAFFSRPFRIDSPIPLATLRAMPRRKSPLHHPHDKLFQAGFRIPANAAAFLRGQLPQAVSARIAWSKLKQVPGHFVDGKMAKAESDLLFRVPFDRQSAFLYILFEHQHDKDPWIALRLLRYMLEIWREFLAKNPAATKLPPILPVVLAQNSTVWSNPDTVLGTLRPPCRRWPASVHPRLHLPPDPVGGNPV